MDTALVERLTDVRDVETAFGEPHPQLARYTGTRSGVGGVLGELGQDAVAVPRTDVIGLGGRVLAQTGGRRRPGCDDPFA